MWSVLSRNRDFRRLFLAELVVFGADWFVMVPLLVLLPELTGSGVWGALVLAADTGIIALLLPYTGTVADRVDRRGIMLAANLAALVATLLLFAVRSAATAWLAILAIGLIAVAKGFYSPAASAALPNVVDPADLPAANAIGGASWGTMTVVGASLGGVLASVAGPYVSFGVAGACLAAAAAVTATIRRPLQAPDTLGGTQRGWAALVEALRYIGHRPRVLALVTVKSAVGLGNGVLVLLLVFVAHFAGGTNWVLSNYALQGEVPDRLRGRVSATDMMLATLAISVSQLAVAAVVDVVDARVVLGACGLVTLTYAVGWRLATRKLTLAEQPA